jgi:hypothetical protein
MWLLQISNTAHFHQTRHRSFESKYLFLRSSFRLFFVGKQTVRKSVGQHDQFASPLIPKQIKRKSEKAEHFFLFPFSFCLQCIDERYESSGKLTLCNTHPRNTAQHHSVKSFCNCEVVRSSQIGLNQFFPRKQTNASSTHCNMHFSRPKRCQIFALNQKRSEPILFFSFLLSQLVFLDE